MSFIDRLDAGDNIPDEFNVLIEIPKNSNIKYEIDTETGALNVDRRLLTAMTYPYNYGIIPKTVEDDGDPIDVLVLGVDPFIPKSMVKSRPVAVLLTEDEEGQDSKIIAVPHHKVDPTYSTVIDLKDIPTRIQNEIKHFFEHYKELEAGKYVRVTGWGTADIAKEKIKAAAENYSKSKQRQ
jgi:inorganic pyrophosphatase